MPYCFVILPNHRRRTTREIPELVEVVTTRPLLQTSTLLRPIRQGWARVARVEALTAVLRPDRRPCVVAERHRLALYVRVSDHLSIPELAGASVTGKCLDYGAVICTRIVYVETFTRVSHLDLKILRIDVHEVILLVGPAPIRPEHGVCVGYGALPDVDYHPGVVIDDVIRLSGGVGGVGCQ